MNTLFSIIFANVITSLIAFAGVFTLIIEEKVFKKTLFTLIGFSAGGLMGSAFLHLIPKAVEEFLYPAMEDFAIDFVFDKGVHARSHRFQLKRFALVGEPPGSVCCRHL